MHAEGCDRYSILFFIPLVLCVRFTFVPEKFLPNFKFLVITLRLNPYKESLSINRFLVEEANTSLSLGQLRGFYSFSFMPLPFPWRISCDSVILNQPPSDLVTAVSGLCTNSILANFW